MQSSHFYFFLRNILISVNENKNINLGSVLLVTCRWCAKFRQSLTLPAPDPEHAFEQLFQSLLQRHVSVHFHRALGTRGITHHRRSLDKKWQKERKIRGNEFVTLPVSSLRYRAPVYRKNQSSIEEDQLVLARRKRWIGEDDDASKSAWNAPRRPDPLTGLAKSSFESCTDPPSRIPSFPVPSRSCSPLSVALYTRGYRPALFPDTRLFLLRFRTESDLTSRLDVGLCLLDGLYLDRVLRGAYLKNRKETASLSLSLFTRIFSSLHRDLIPFFLSFLLSKFFSFSLSLFVI